jgi:hypothetical protein
MTQEQLIVLLLTLTVQAWIDETLPSKTELKALHAFLVKSHAIHGVHPFSRSGVLSDWIDRLREGIQVASEFLVPSKKEASCQQHLSQYLAGLATVNSFVVIFGINDGCSRHTRRNSYHFGVETSTNSVHR